MRPETARTFSSMDVSEANTEPFFQFHRFHENLNEVLKVVSCGLETLRQRVVDGGEQINATLNYKDGEPSGKRIRVNAPALTRSRMTVANLSIAHVYSAFDEFCTQMVGESDRIRAAFGPTHVPGTIRTESGDISLRLLYDRCGFGGNDFEEFLPTFDYFQMARNLIVHRSGRASEAFVNRSASATSAGANVPVVRLNREIEMQPIHAITASDNCHRIAQRVNARFIETFGLRGIMKMACYHALESPEHPDRLPSHARPEDAIGLFLDMRYRVKGVKTLRTTRTLKEYGLYDAARAGFDRLYGRASASAKKSGRTKR